MTNRAAYSATGQQFLADSPDAILGSLTANAFFAVDLSQRNAWLRIIEHLKSTIADVEEAFVFLEFTIPRMGRRVDAVVLHHGCVFVVEYKVGSERHHPADVDQVTGYALDLKNFHEPSHSVPIVPILIATKAEQTKLNFQMAKDKLYECVCSNGNDLSKIIQQAPTTVDAGEIDPDKWVSGRYKPTPTIIEAAQALYRNHRVDEITRNEAGAENLSATAAYISALIEHCKRTSRKAICFITGVPGSGKTLAGLNIASIRTRIAEEEYAVFLSGNGPLVKVLRTALARDQKDRAKAEGKTLPKAAARRSVEQFIQNVHHFRDANLNSQLPPIEKVVVFDEAQRAWNRQQTSQFMRKKRSCPDFNESEPEFLLSVMNRHTDWCTVVCLVGTGQEINTGEAGLGEWLLALSKRFTNWQVHLSDRIVAEPNSFSVSDIPPGVITDGKLHLATNIRSFRSEAVSAFVSSMIDGKPEEALTLSKQLGGFEFKITRDARRARNWLRTHRRGTERAGVVAFSNAVRLKPEGIFVKANINPEDWFLAERSDVRSSDYLEDVATEFDVQGLELDWACVFIDANLRIGTNGHITPVGFRGTRWQAVNDPSRQRYILNAHRVLLTRARQGVIVFVPKGDADDRTRNPKWYDDLHAYFLGCGVQTFPD
jgi:Uncharacterized conserved protein (DUF2075)